MTAPNWRQVARKQAKHFAQQRKAWPMENDLLTLIVEYDDMDAARELDRLLRTRREKERTDRGSGGRKSGDSRNERNERLVLDRIAQMKPLPPPRNLVRALTDAGMGRNGATAALKRLALKGKLPDVYRDHFSRARPRSNNSV